MLIKNCDYSNDAIECMLETATASDLPAHLRKEVQDAISSNIDFLKGKNKFCNKIREKIYHFEKARDSDWCTGRNGLTVCGDPRGHPAGGVTRTDA